MDADFFSHSLGQVLQIAFLDLMLSGDNALVIALACRGLPPALRRRAMLLGTAGAVSLRLLLTALTGLLLQWPLLKLLGGLLLLAIAVKLLLGDEAPPTEQAATPRLASAIAVIVLADLSLSLDNVLALAAVAQGSLALLLLGLLLSIPLLMFGSLLLGRLLDEYPLLTPLAGAVLGALAGQLIAADPLYADWVDSQSPGLHLALPLLAAGYVLCQSRIIRRQRATLAPLPPWRPWARLAERLDRLGDAAPRPILLTEATPAASLPSSPASITAPVLAPVATPPETPPLAPAAKAKPAAQRDANAIEALGKPLVFIAALLGALALAWLALHLLSQGLLPAPKHPAGVSRSAPTRPPLKP